MWPKGNIERQPSADKPLEGFVMSAEIIDFDKHKDLRSRERTPESVTFFIGPPGAPSEVVEAYSNAVELADNGDREALNEFLEIQKNALGILTEGDGDGEPWIRSFLSGAVDEEIGNLDTFVGIGFSNNHWVPTLTIHLDRLTNRNGKPIGQLLGKTGSDAIAGVLGLCFKAEWIQTILYWPI
jgi:hypothetical protein